MLLLPPAVLQMEGRRLSIDQAFCSEGDQAISEVHGVANQEVALPEAGKEHCTGVL